MLLRLLRCLQLVSWQCVILYRLLFRSLYRLFLNLFFNYLNPRIQINRGKLLILVRKIIEGLCTKVNEWWHFIISFDNGGHFKNLETALIDDFFAIFSEAEGLDELRIMPLFLSLFYELMVVWERIIVCQQKWILLFEEQEFVHVYWISKWEQGSIDRAIFFSRYTIHFF